MPLRKKKLEAGGEQTTQKLSFKAICMTRAGRVPLICPAVVFPIEAFGALKFARLKALNISHR